jgi:flagellin-like protein
VFEIMVVTRKNDEAVSPVIGVILMVAITVILAAVIAAFVFGMSGNITKTKVVAATATQSGSNINVVYQGGQDAPTVTRLSVTWPNGTVTPNSTTLTVGQSITGLGAGTTGQDHVVVTASFTDGSAQVILDSYL